MHLFKILQPLFNFLKAWIVCCSEQTWYIGICMQRIGKNSGFSPTLIDCSFSVFFLVCPSAPSSLDILFPFVLSSSTVALKNSYMLNDSQSFIFGSDLSLDLRLSTQVKCQNSQIFVWAECLIHTPYPSHTPTQEMFLLLWFSSCLYKMLHFVTQAFHDPS